MEDHAGDKQGHYHIWKCYPRPEWQALPPTSIFSQQKAHTIASKWTRIDSDYVGIGPGVEGVAQNHVSFRACCILEFPMLHTSLLGPLFTALNQGGVASLQRGGPLQANKGKGDVDLYIGHSTV
ncbi:10671_t:CDS:2 [Acaulospora colombiana]|uniref:10671_t:CDS:1 n=1 Tax=Acaulospora colombiana TaxID=27376 RepID=A0ACA9M003_9GLOM|nr:10671_t:CDS:2 [Acaulospora colombiana]